MAWMGGARTSNRAMLGSWAAIAVLLLQGCATQLTQSLREKYLSPYDLTRVRYRLGCDDILLVGASTVKQNGDVVDEATRAINVHTRNRIYNVRIPKGTLGAVRDTRDVGDNWIFVRFEVGIDILPLQRLAEISSLVDGSGRLMVATLL